MERKTWVVPMTLVQKFEANETVAADTQCWYVGCNRDLFYVWKFGEPVETHAKGGCKAASSQVLRDTDGDNVIDEMIETKADGLKCDIYTDNSYSVPLPVSEVDPDQTIYWITNYRGTTYHHRGTVQLGDTSHPNRS